MTDNLKQRIAEAIAASIFTVCKPEEIWVAAQAVLDIVEPIIKQIQDDAKNLIGAILQVPDDVTIGEVKQTMRDSLPTPPEKE